LPENWKGSIMVSIYKKGDKMDLVIIWGISIFPTTFKLLSKILLSNSTLYAEEMIGDCLFRRNMPPADRLFLVKYFRKSGNTMKHCISYL
jgi:hypothetical protein